MSVVRLLGFNTLSCGCLVGRYREVASQRQVAYIEEKGQSCDDAQHRKNHTLSPARTQAAVRDSASVSAG